MARCKALSHSSRPSRSSAATTLAAKLRIQATSAGVARSAASWASAGSRRNRTSMTSSMLETSGSFFRRSEEHTSELQSLMRISYAVFCLKKKKYSKHGKQDIIGILLSKKQYTYLTLTQ